MVADLPPIHRGNGPIWSGGNGTKKTPHELTSGVLKLRFKIRELIIFEYWVLLLPEF